MNNLFPITNIIVSKVENLTNNLVLNFKHKNVYLDSQKYQLIAIFYQKLPLKFKI